MAYAIQTDLENVVSSDSLRQLTDDDKDGVSDASVITAMIAKSDGLIDSYVGKIYTTPFNPIPPVITQISSQIAVYWLFSRRRIKSPPDVEKQYDEAIAWLKAIKDNEIVIPGLATPGIAFNTNRNYKDDRDFRKRWEGGGSDDEKSSTFGTFTDGVGY